jgi:iron complex outermembrane receptor protein
LLIAAIFGSAQAFAQAPQPEAANVPSVAASSPAGASGTAQAEYKESEAANPQTMPTSKAVVSGATLQQSSQDGYAEAVRNVAGVSPANSKGSANDSINIRGIKLNLFSNYRLDGGLPITGVITVPVED